MARTYLFGQAGLEFFDHTRSTPFRCSAIRPGLKRQCLPPLSVSMGASTRRRRLLTCCLHEKQTSRRGALAAAGTTATAPPHTLRPRIGPG